MPIDDILRCHILKCRPIDLILNRFTLSQSQQELFNQYKSRWQLGEPLQYILGTWDFMGLSFLLNPHVLIPRPETEMMVEYAIKILQLRVRPHLNLRVLDLGTGSGCIAIALAKQLPSLQLIAIDLSPHALSLAKENAERHGVMERITFKLGDMKDLSMYDQDERFDLIISNPPYILREQIASLPADVQAQPHMALDGGEDGMEFYRIFIKMTPGLLSEKGCLMMEFGDGQSNLILDLCQSKFNQISRHHDLTGRERFIVCENNKGSS